MDLTQFNTADAAEEGRALHLRHPFKNHLLYVGEGASKTTGKLVNKEKPHEKVTVTVRGWHAESVRAHVRKLAADKLRAADDGEDSQSEEERLDAVKEQAHAILDLIVIGWDNITDSDGAPRKCDKANKVQVIGSNDSFENQVLKFSQDQANFFGKPAKS